MNNGKWVVAILALTIASFGTSAHARSQGTKCGLTDTYLDESWEKFGKSYSLYNITPEEALELPTLVKQQLIIAAKRVNQALYEGSAEIKSAFDAIELLRQDSEAKDLEVTHFRVNGHAFTQVLYFPGGNAYGFIFRYGKRSIVAEVNDGDISCTQ